MTKLKTNQKRKIRKRKAQQTNRLRNQQSQNFMSFEMTRGSILAKIKRLLPW